MLQTALRYSLCASKNYTSTFKIRSRLGQFFKHVHPDQLQQAPSHIKQQNLRSLTNLNSYIDAVNQAKPIESKLLKFYLSEKVNMKSKKFYSFNIELPQISNTDADLGESRAKTLIDNIVDVLNKKFKQSKHITNKNNKVILTHKDQQHENDITDRPSERQRFNNLSATVAPFDRKRNLQKEQQNLKTALNSKYMEAEKDTLSSKLKSNITFADTSTNKQMMWSRMIAQQSGIYKDFQNVLDNLIDPRLIYFDQQLALEEVQEFKKRLLPGSMDRVSQKKSKLIIELCQKIESFSPPICLYVSKEYSGSKIPGFLSVPFNFQAVEFAQKYEQLIETVIAEQQKYEQFYDYYLQLCTSLKQHNGIKVDIPEFKNNDDIWMRLLTLKRLQKYDFSWMHKNIATILFDRNQLAIFKKHYNIVTQKTLVMYESKMIVAVDFVEEDMQEFMDSLKLKNVVS